MCPIEDTGYLGPKRGTRVACLAVQCPLQQVKPTSPSAAQRVQQEGSPYSISISVMELIQPDLGVRSATSCRKYTDEASWLWPKSADMYSLNIPLRPSCNACQYRAGTSPGRGAKRDRPTNKEFAILRDQLLTEIRIGCAGSSHPAMYLYVPQRINSKEAP